MADYNINAVTRRVVFTGSAGLGPYSFTFEVLDQNDLAVYFNATKLTLTTDYTVTVNANGTGSVTIVTGTNVPTTPIASDQIVIVGARDIERTTDFVTAGDLRASALNEQLDGQIIMIQQIAEENKRGMRAPVYDPALVEDGGVVDMELPTKASRAGKTLAFDSDGNPIVGEDIGNWRGDWAASVAYDVRDIVKDSVNSSIYRCNTAHTSSGTAPISGNADVAKWDLVIDATAVADAEAAQAAAEAAQAAAETAETNAASSATSSASSATASAASATASAASASAAATSEANSATSETNAASSASSASTSATNSATSATASAASASSASTSASNASTSETNAALSASSASTSAATATTQAGIATAKAGEASTSASNAATSEANSATSETNAASSATAAAASQVSAANSAASAAAAFDNFDDTYLGSYATDPTVDNDGDALVQGALYFNTTANEMRVYDGGNWIAASSAGGVSLILYEYTATAGQTTFSGADDNAATLSYTANNIQVVMNGVILDPSDYTATNGTSIVLASGAALNDILNVYAFKSFSVADTVSASAGGTFNANVTVNGTLAATAVTGDGSGLSNVGGNPPTIQTFTSSGTWTKPTGCKTIKVTVVGGGGGGGSARGLDGACNVAAGGGGAGGGAIEFIDVTAVSSVTVTIGAGGSAGTNGGNGGIGGTSSFGSYCSATGGGAGGGVSTTGNQSGFGGAPSGVGSSGDINIEGGGGHHGQLVEGGLPCSGSGGVSIFGGGGSRIRRTSTGGTAGEAGTLGGGGSGSATRDQASSKDGGAGGAGIVVVEEYY